VREIEVGVRVDAKSGFSNFGIEEVNEAIKRGDRVVEVVAGGTIMEKLGENAGSVRLTLTGFALKIRLDDNAIHHELS
jgi:hypothetical protein